QTKWVELAGVAGLGIGELTQAQVGVVPLLVANVGGTLPAYRNASAAAGARPRGGGARQGRDLVIEGGAIRELRRLANRNLVDRRPDEPAAAPEERCDLCSVSIPADHRHMLHVEERRIVCTCETCRALFAGDGPHPPAAPRRGAAGGGGA